MILTRDNILRYIREKKAVTPTMIAEDFDTTTMIASAALSELSKDKLIKITYLKLSSSPYYYDPKQDSILIELGLKHLKGYDKEIFLKLKEQEVINATSLSIQESLAIERIKDFAKELVINVNNRELKFWVWYQRDLATTKKQILDLLNQNNSKNKNEEKLKSQKKENTKQPSKNNDLLSVKNQENLKKNIIESTKENKTRNIETNFNNSFSNTNNTSRNNNINYNNTNIKLDNSNFESKEIFENKIETFIENYFKENYLLMESKLKTEKGIEYDIKLIANKIIIDFDCFYFKKKPTETDVIKFYSSSIKPKLIFIENAPKKLLKLAENLENLTIVNI